MKFFLPTHKPTTYPGNTEDVILRLAFSFKLRILFGMNRDRFDILGASREEIADFLISIGEKQAYRSSQIQSWLYNQGETEWDNMSNLPGRIREKLRKFAKIGIPENVTVYKSGGGTTRFLFEAEDGCPYESVLIPEMEGKKLIRNTACISSQSGCALGCTFCATAKLGLKRDLTKSEIAGQLWYIAQYSGITAPITNVVFMGMGEPLLNLDNVIPVIKVIKGNPGFGISGRRITISTAGIVPGIDRLIEEGEKTRLAVSLNAPDDGLRKELMPIAKKYSIKDILSAAERFYDFTGRWVTMEYVMLKGINDSEEDAARLAALLKDYNVKVNIIPLNETETIPYSRPPLSVLQKFAAILLASGITATIRNSQGSDIDAACGQLAGQLTEIPDI